MSDVLNKVGGALPEHVVCIQLLQYQRRVETGDIKAVLDAVAFCAREEIVMPHWLAVAFCSRMHRFNTLQDKEIGESFSVEWPKGKSFTAAKRKQDSHLIPVVVYQRVMELHRPPHKLPIDNELFARVAAEFRSNRTEIGNLYATGKRQMTPPHKRTKNTKKNAE